jgi:NADPH2:quinone reductase
VGIPTLAHGGYATHALVDAATAMGLPAWLSASDSAAMHHPVHLGWFALHERARLQPRGTLLVHAAAGGTGSGALQMGKALGAKVIATAGSDEKVDYSLELGADVAVTYRATDFVEVVMEATYGHGVDVAFDAVGGDVTLETFKCMGFNGRHLIAGWSEGIELENAHYLTPRAMAYGNFSLCGVCLVYVNDPLGERRTLGFNWPGRSEGQQAHATILEMIRTGRIRPTVTRELSFAEIPSTLEDMEQRNTMGRLVALIDRPDRPAPEQNREHSRPPGIGLDCWGSLRQRTASGRFHRDHRPIRRARSALMPHASVGTRRTPGRSRGSSAKLNGTVSFP